MGKIFKGSYILVGGRKAKKKRPFFSQHILLIAPLIALLWMCAGILFGYYYFTKDLPDLSSVTHYQPPVVTSVLSDDNRLIGEFYRERRIVVPLKRIPDVVIKAFISAEDNRFFEHSGIDYLGILRAAFVNIEAGRVVQGGSTITQQVAKSLLLSPRRKFSRKVKEAILAYRIEKNLNKSEILYLYLNQIYLGHGAYGVETASQNYFGKHIEEVGLAEASLMAGLPRAPSRYSPFTQPKKAKLRQKYVLNRMLEEGFISMVEATDAYNQPLEIHGRDISQIKEAPYFTEHVRRYLEDKFGTKTLYEQGLHIYTTVDLRLQEIAKEAIQWGLRRLDKRQGYRGPLQHIDEVEYMEEFVFDLTRSLEGEEIKVGNIYQGLVREVDNLRKQVVVSLGGRDGIMPLKYMAWARRPDPEIAYGSIKIRTPSEVLTVGDVILTRVVKADEEYLVLALEQVPEAQAALIAIDPITGFIKAMLGGYDFKMSQFNRTIQAKRQGGSAFKPIIYAAALERGYTPATTIIDSPIIYDTEHEFTWKPRNFTEKFYGPTTFRDALAHSRNVVTVKILRDIGIDYVIEFARNLGISNKLNRDLSMALGSSALSLIELTTAYGIFANGGRVLRPSTIKKIYDRRHLLVEDVDFGNIIVSNENQKDDPYIPFAVAGNGSDSDYLISPQTAYIMTHLLKNVVEHGTGRSVRSLDRPVAGKTGTTDDFKDAWFIGYTPNLVVGVWVGFDEERSLGRYETGAKAACPIWLRFMKATLKDVPPQAFLVPPGLTFVRIDPKTGLLARPDTQKAIFEVFREGEAPTEYTPDEHELMLDKFFRFDMDLR